MASQVKAPKKPPPPERRPIHEELDAAIEAFPGTPYELAAQAGVDRSTVTRYLAGSRGFSMEVLEKLAVPLKLRLIQVDATPKRKMKR